MMTIGEFIEKRRKELGITLDEIGKITGVGKSTVKKWETGLISNMGRDKIANLSKILKVSPAVFINDSIDDYNEAVNLPVMSKPKGVKIPVLGYVRAGIPISAVEEILDYEEISEEMSRQGKFFALKIKGDSMEPKFSEGDVVIVQQESTVENGDIAVVLVNGDDATVKKFYRSDSGIKLISTNPAYDPFFFTPDEVNTLPVQIIGKVVELRAKFYSIKESKKWDL